MDLFNDTKNFIEKYYTGSTWHHINSEVYIYRNDDASYLCIKFGKSELEYRVLEHQVMSSVEKAIAYNILSLAIDSVKETNVEEETVEMTLEEVADQLNINVEKLRIKD